MQTNPEDIDIILPFGELLRGFLEQPLIGKADLRMVLRARGVFVGRGEKCDTIPLLISSLLSPAEFDILRERLATREDSPKTINQYFTWLSDRPLLESIPDTLNIAELIKDDFVNYKVLGSPTFVPIGAAGDQIRVDFDIERRDLSKSWFASTNKFTGSIELARIMEGSTVKLVMTHTADETKQLAQRITHRLTNHFRESAVIPSEGGILRILFGDFTNAERVLFFLNLTADIHEDQFTFQEIVDFAVCPAQDGQFPAELKWMEKNVRELNLKGKELQDNLFVKNKKYHDSLLFFRMEARFAFTSHAATGVCGITFEFADFNPDNPLKCEFETTISHLTLAADFAHLSKAKTKEELLRLIDPFTHKQYERIMKARKLAEPPVGEVTGVSSESVAS